MTPSTVRNQIMSVLVAAVALAPAGPARADDLPVLGAGHADAGVNYENDAWDLHVHAEDADIEFAPDQVVLEVHGHAVQKVPQDPRFEFLGPAGSPVWVLPETEDHHLLFLGLGTEELATGIFVNDTVQLALKSVAGPGHFALYGLDPLGNPVVSMNSRDGIDAGDTLALTAGRHLHANWAFSTPGAYRIGLEASGQLVATGQTTTSPIAEYLFEVEYAALLELAPNDASTLSLGWLSRPDHEYHLQSTSDLAHNSWSALPGVEPIAGTGGRISVAVPLIEGARYFRLEIHGESHPSPASHESASVAGED